MRQLTAASIVVLLLLPMPRPVEAQASVPGPVIDIHAHTFNLRYLPVKGILESYCVPYLLACSVSRILESLVVTKAQPSTVLSFEKVKRILEVDPMNRDLDPWLDLLQERIHEAGQHRRLQRKKGRLVRYVSAGIEEERRAGDRRPAGMPGAASSSREEGEEEPPILDDYFSEPRESASSEAAAPGAFSGAPPAASGAPLKKQLRKLTPIDLVIGILKKALNEEAKPAKFAGFLTILLLEEEDIVKLMQWNYPHVELFLSQMMDMEMTYRDPPELPFQLQTQEVEKLARQHEELLWFAAYDPFRAQALTPVQEALKHGAIGVKMYPPSGYRPEHNRIPGLTTRGLCKFLPRHRIRRQHASRYKEFLRRSNGDPVKAGELLDEKIRIFLELAENERFAILSHHTPAGFESAKRYGLLMAHPCLWGEVLKKRPELLLILGHAGGGEAWFGEPGADPGRDSAWDHTIEHPLDRNRMTYSFDRQAYNLCVAFPNVYCDLGYSMEVLKEPNRRNFEARLKRLTGNQALSGGPVPESWDFCGIQDLPPRYDLGEKILYGSDWMMPEAAFAGTEYFKAFQNVFDGELAPYRHLFFGENARSLLCRVKNPPHQLKCGAALPASH